VQAFSSGPQGWRKLSEVAGASVPEPQGAVRPREPGEPRRRRVARARPLAPPRLPLYFQCPACRATLAVPDPEGYDGSPAPCCECGALITAPAVAARRQP
jgi:hypothetical protein